MESVCTVVIRREYRLLRFWRSVKFKQNHGTLDFLSTHDHVVLEISKCYSCGFHPISAKLHDNNGYCRIRLPFLAFGQIKKKCGTLKF